MMEEGTMGNDDQARKRPPTPLARPSEADRRLWVIVLAGGEGVRLRSLVRLVCGENRPKQCVPLLESQTFAIDSRYRLNGRALPTAPHY